MTNDRSAEIKNYIYQTFVKEDESLKFAKRLSMDAGLPVIAIPENVGKLLYMITRLKKPKRILEIGTLGGYSTLWLAKGAPEAEIFTIEYNTQHAAVARKNFQHADLERRVHLLEGNALEILQQFIHRKEAPFDLIFLDANKEDYPSYLPLIQALAGPETLLLTDNLIPKGSPINQPLEGDFTAQSIYEYNEMLASNPRIETILATTIVGENGRIDGLGISLLNPKL